MIAGFLCSGGEFIFSIASQIIEEDSIVNGDTSSAAISVIILNTDSQRPAYTITI